MSLQLGIEPYTNEQTKSLKFIVGKPGAFPPYDYGVAYDSGKDEIFVTNAADSTVSVISYSAVPEFSNASLISVMAAMVAVTICAVGLAVRKSEKSSVRP